MLSGELFLVEETKNINENEFRITFRCNALHPVFKGHFPENPILPGVCMIQFVRESLETILSRKLQLNQSKSIKFVNIVNPEKENSMQLNIKITSTENEQIDVSASIKSETTSFFQFKSKYKTIS